MYSFYYLLVMCKFNVVITGLIADCLYVTEDEKYVDLTKHWLEGMLSYGHMVSTTRVTVVIFARLLYLSR